MGVTGAVCPEPSLNSRVGSPLCGGSLWTLSNTDVQQPTWVAPPTTLRERYRSVCAAPNRQAPSAFIRHGGIAPGFVKTEGQRRVREGRDRGHGRQDAAWSSRDARGYRRRRFVRSVR